MAAGSGRLAGSGGHLLRLGGFGGGAQCIANWATARPAQPKMLKDVG